MSFVGFVVLCIACFSHSARATEDVDRDDPPIVVFDVDLYLASSPHPEVDTTPFELVEKYRTLYSVRYAILDSSTVARLYNANKAVEPAEIESAIMVLMLKNSRGLELPDATFAMDPHGTVFRDGHKIAAPAAFFEILETLGPDVPFSRWFPWLNKQEGSSTGEKGAEGKPEHLASPTDQP